MLPSPELVDEWKGDKWNAVVSLVRMFNAAIDVFTRDQGWDYDRVELEFFRAFETLHAVGVPREIIAQVAMDEGIIRPRG